MRLYAKLGKLKALIAVIAYFSMLGLLIASLAEAGSIEMRIIGGVLLGLWLIMGVVALWIFIPQWDPWLRKMRRTHRGEKIVALTFDDGPTDPWTSRILDILRDQDVRATFFVVAQNAQHNAETVKRAHEEGHVIGGHSATHRMMTFLNAAQRLEEIEASITAIEEIIGCRPNFFRLPYGFKFPGMYRMLRTWDLVPIPWTKGLWDTAMPPAHKVVQRCVRRTKPFEVVLLHDGVMGDEPDAHREHVVEALPDIIAAYKQRGYRFATIADLGEATCEAPPQRRTP